MARAITLPDQAGAPTVDKDACVKAHTALFVLASPEDSLYKGTPRFKLSVALDEEGGEEMTLFLGSNVMTIPVIVSLREAFADSDEPVGPVYVTAATTSGGTVAYNLSGR